MESVPSVLYQYPKRPIIRIVKIISKVIKLTPKESTSKSVINVPSILIITIRNQYAGAKYFFILNCQITAPVVTIPIITTVFDKPNSKLTLTKSAAVSPTVVDKILIIQK